MPSNRREYMRDYMRQKRAADKARGRDVKGAETPVSDTLDMSHAATVSRETPTEIVRLPQDVTPAQVAAVTGNAGAVGDSTTKRVRQPWEMQLLAAPDDDCAACGHDRQTYHLNAGGVCWAPAPNTRSRRCDCPSYVSAAEPF